jgi:hypothetical protein
MDGVGQHDFKQKKSGIERQIPHILIYMWNLKKVDFIREKWLLEARKWRE